MLTYTWLICAMFYGWRNVLILKQIALLVLPINRSSTNVNRNHCFIIEKILTEFSDHTLINKSGLTQLSNLGLITLDKNTC